MARGVWLTSGFMLLTSDVVYVDTLAHTAAEAVKLYRDKTDDVIAVHVDMATALPVSYYSAENAKFFADKFMAKEHLVTVHTPKKPFVVKIIYDFVKVIPEGVTACHAFLQDKPEYKKSKILHIAIGEGTTEFPVTQGIVFDPLFITGTNNGNGYAIDRVIEDFKRHYGLQKFTRQNYSNILKDKSHKYHDTAMEFVLPALAVQATEIVEAAKAVIQKADNDIDIVLVYGGGSILMRSTLERELETFCKRAKIKLVYMDAAKAVTIEAEGLRNFVNGNIFAKIKKAAGK